MCCNFDFAHSLLLFTAYCRSVIHYLQPWFTVVLRYSRSAWTNVISRYSEHNSVSQRIHPAGIHLLGTEVWLLFSFAPGHKVPWMLEVVKDQENSNKTDALLAGCTGINWGFAVPGCYSILSLLRILSLFMLLVVSCQRKILISARRDLRLFARHPPQNFHKKYNFLIVNCGIWHDMKPFMGVSLDRVGRL